MIDSITGESEHLPIGCDQLQTQERKHMNCTLVTKELPTSIIIIIFRNTRSVVVKISGPWTRLSAFEF